MTSPFHDIVNYNDAYFEDYLEKLSLFFIFEPVFTQYPDKAIAKLVIKFICLCFSIESPKISVGGDRRTEKANLFKELFGELKIDDEQKQNLYEDLVYLKNVEVIEAAKRWMKYKDNRQLEYLMTLHEQYVQQQQASLSPIRKATGEIDWSVKMNCVENMTKLKLMIKDAEAELQQNDEKLKEAYRETKATNKKKVHLGVERFAG